MNEGSEVSSDTRVIRLYLVNMSYYTDVSIISFFLVNDNFNVFAKFMCKCIFFLIIIQKQAQFSENELR